jgi:ankyrin repeat protein
MSNAFDKSNLSEAQLAAIAAHEDLHRLLAKTPQGEVQPVFVADDVIVNGPDGKQLNWRGLMAKHLDANCKLASPGDRIVDIEDKSGSISPDQLREFRQEVAKAKRFQEQVKRMGFRRVDAARKKAARKAKKQAKLV